MGDSSVARPRLLQGRIDHCAVFDPFNSKELRRSRRKPLTFLKPGVPPWRPHAPSTMALLRAPLRRVKVKHSAIKVPTRYNLRPPRHVHTNLLPMVQELTFGLRANNVRSASERKLAQLPNCLKNSSKVPRWKLLEVPATAEPLDRN